MREMQVNCSRIRSFNVAYPFADAIFEYYIIG